VCSLSAETEHHRYQKELLLPRTVQGDAVKVTANNGIVEIVAPAADAE
jgi:HSP20 family molecular chaperone IbpA